MPEGLSIARPLPADLTIRPVKRGDFDGLMALMRGEAIVSAPKVPEAIRRKVEGRDQNAFRLVALLADEIIGQAALTFGFGPMPATGMLTIIVREDRRGRGVATTLLAELLAAASARLGLNRVEVNVFADNEPAIRLYQNLGFMEKARHLGGEAREILLMAKNLSTNM
jgi:L-phenylalanine/L-methionine N-acetyltransferase